MLPGVAATSVFGDQIAAALEDLSTVNYWAAGAVVAAFALFIVFVKRWLSRAG